MSSIPRPIEHTLAMRDPHIGAPTSVLSLLGSAAWGLALGVVGLWVLVGESLPGFLDSLPRFERVCVGLGMLSGGQLIFLMLVASRIFPAVPRKVSAPIHWGLFLLGCSCLILVVVSSVLGEGA